MFKRNKLKTSLSDQEIFERHATQDAKNIRGMIEWEAKKAGIPPSEMEQILVEKKKIVWNWDTQIK